MFQASLAQCHTRNRSSVNVCWSRWSVCSAWSDCSWDRSLSQPWPVWFYSVQNSRAFLHTCCSCATWGLPWAPGEGIGFRSPQKWTWKYLRVTVLETIKDKVRKTKPSRRYLWTRSWGGSWVKLLETWIYLDHPLSSARVQLREGHVT